MSVSSLSVERSHWLTRCADYIELTKPKIAVLVLVTVAASAYVACWGQPNPWAVLHVLIGVTLVAASASALNQWLERYSDATMPRTANRPLPAGRLTSRQVLVFSAVTICAGLAYLAAVVSLTTAALGLATWVCYVWIYTPMKSRSSWNTAVGAVAGALPVLIGWAGSGATLDPREDLRGAGLFLIVFLWQFPHFMAIAWLYRRQYRDAGMKMLTVVDPSGRRAGVQAVLCAAALLPASLAPVAASAPQAQWYAVAAFLLGLGQLLCATVFFRKLSDQSARWLLRASLVYLPAILLLLMFLPALM